MTTTEEQLENGTEKPSIGSSHSKKRKKRGKVTLTPKQREVWLMRFAFAVWDLEEAQKYLNGNLDMPGWSH